MNVGRHTLYALTLLWVGSACSPSDLADGSSANCGNPLPDAWINHRPAMDRCCPDPSAHVDCFGGGACRGATVVAQLYAPVYACTDERANQWFREKVCVTLGSPIGTCPGTTQCEGAGSGRLSDDRYPDCDAPVPFELSSSTRMLRGQLASFWRLACSDRGPSVGSACTDDTHCRPAPATVRGRLRCVAWRCAEVSRPAPEAGFGQACVASRTPLGASPTCEMCVTPSDGCGAFCSQRCLFDEDCPDAFVCAYAGRLCGGACVPAGHRAALLGGPEPADAGAPSPPAPYPNCVDGGALPDASLDGGAISDAATDADSIDR